MDRASPRDDRAVEHILSCGRRTIVDAGDAHVLQMATWCTCRSPQKEERYYVCAWSGGRTIYLHRTILGAPAGTLVDHRNRDTLDNRRSNLRLATRSQNNANKASTSATGYRGVYPAGSRFVASISVPGKSSRGRALKLGYFGTPEEAAKAYDAAALIRFGEFAQLNFPSVS